jgi:hypothetical protein
LTALLLSVVHHRLFQRDIDALWYALGSRDIGCQTRQFQKLADPAHTATPQERYPKMGTDEQPM